MTTCRAVRPNVGLNKLNLEVSLSLLALAPVLVVPVPVPVPVLVRAVDAVLSMWGKSVGST